MTSDYTFFYLEANIVCIIIFAILFIKNLHSVDRQEKQRIYDHVLLFSMIYFVFDSLWALQTGGILPNVRAVALIVNFNNHLVMSLVAFYWYLFVEVSECAPYIKKFKNRLLCMIPAIISIYVMLFLCLYSSEAILDSEGQVTFAYYVLFLGAPMVYVIVASIKSFIRAGYKENYALRSQYIITAISPVAVLVSGVVQTLFINAPLFCFGITIMMLYVYISSIENIVSQDPLTSLNNRAQLKRYVAKDLKVPESGEKIYIFMVDLNKFKGINDTYGHIEGDNAIVMAAEGLKNVCAEEKQRHFIARYGGDEFLIVAKLQDEGEALYLKERLKEGIFKRNQNSGAKYELRASIGFAEYNGIIENFNASLKKADDALYEDKHWKEAGL